MLVLIAIGLVVLGLLPSGTHHRWCVRCGHMWPI
jgi:hypothetical protein